MRLLEAVQAPSSPVEAPKPKMPPALRSATKATHKPARLGLNACLIIDDALDFAVDFVTSENMAGACDPHGLRLIARRLVEITRPAAVHAIAERRSIFAAAGPLERARFAKVIEDMEADELFALCLELVARHDANDVIDLVGEDRKGRIFWDVIDEYGDDVDLDESIREARRK